MTERIQDVCLAVTLVAATLTVAFSCRAAYWARVAARHDRKTARILQEIKDLTG